MKSVRHLGPVLSLALFACSDASSGSRQDGRVDLAHQRETGVDRGRREAASGDVGSPAFLSCYQTPFPVSLDRSCGQPADCFAALHMKNCCGTMVAVGLNVKEKDRFAAAEKQCASTFPGCGCPTGPTELQDGSQLAWGEVAGVTCQGGICTTFVKGCGAPCASGKRCYQCAAKPERYYVCSTSCNSDGDCKDPGLAKCEQSETFQKFCTANIGCGSK